MTFTFCLIFLFIRQKGSQKRHFVALFPFGMEFERQFPNETKNLGGKTYDIRQVYH